MSPLTTGIVGIVFLFLLFATGMPIAFVMTLIGWLGYIYLGSVDGGMHILGISFYAGGTTYTLSVIPLFVLMGQFASHAGLSNQIYRAVFKGIWPFWVAMLVSLFILTLFLEIALFLPNTMR